MADTTAMRLHAAVLCRCGAEVTPPNQVVPQHVLAQSLCPSCREREHTANASFTRHALTELVAGERGYALHRRTLPGMGASVDHVFVGASGVFVIHLQRAPEADVSVARPGSRFASGVEVLTVNGSPAAQLVDAVRAECAEVAAGLADRGQGEVPVIPVLCFVDARLPRRAKNRRIDGVRLVNAPTLADEVNVEGPLDADRRFLLAMSLVSFLPAPA